MTDFVNQNMAVANADADGLYPWMSIRSGGNSNVFSNLKVTRPLNMGGTFVYNSLGVVSAAISKYNNTKPSIPAVIVNGVPVINAPADATLECESIGQLTVDENTLVMTQVAGTDLLAYARMTLTSSSLLGSGDQIKVGFQVNGIGPVYDSVTVTVPALGQDPVSVVIQTDDIGIPVTAGQTLQVTVENLTVTPTPRGVLATNYQFIARHP